MSEAQVGVMPAPGSREATTQSITPSSPNNTGVTPLIVQQDEDAHEDDEPIVVGEASNSESVSRLVEALRKARLDTRTVRRELRSQLVDAQSQLQNAQSTLTRLQPLEAQVVILTQERDVLAQRVTVLETAISADLDAEIATWPDEVKLTMPKDADVATRMTWASTHRALAQKLMKPSPTITGNPAGPTPVGNGVAGAKTATEQAAVRRMYKNIF